MAYEVEKKYIDLHTNGKPSAITLYSSPNSRILSTPGFAQDAKLKISKNFKKYVSQELLQLLTKGPNSNIQSELNIPIPRSSYSLYYYLFNVASILNCMTESYQYMENNCYYNTAKTVGPEENSDYIIEDDEMLNKCFLIKEKDINNEANT